MLRPRIIPCLLVHDGGLVKTVRFRDAKYVGDPINAVRIFNEKESDELVVLDIDATRNGVEPDYRMISHLADECRMPLCYGGGIASAVQAKRIIGLGVEKVAISAAAISRPELITEMAEAVGSQSVVVVIDTLKRMLSANPDVYTHNGTRKAAVGAIEFAQRAAEMGAGEIVLNAIDRDGTMKGYDIAMAKRLRDSVGVPVTFLGGCGSLNDMEALIREVGVVGASAGSLFVFKGQYRAVLINYPNAQAKEELIVRALG